MNILFILFSLTISFICTIQHAPDTYGETISFYPLKLFLEEEPQILGYGGIQVSQKIEPNIWRSPAYLSRQKESSLSTRFILDDTWRVKKGDFKGSNLRSYAVGLNAHLPLARRPGQVIGFVIKSDWAKGRFQVENAETRLWYEEDYTQFNIAYGIEALPWLALGGSIGKEDREGETQYGWEAIISPVRDIDIGYREYQRNFALNIFAQDNQEGLIPIRLRERIGEIFLKANIFQPLSLSLSEDLAHTDSYEMTISFSLKRFRFSGTMEENNLTHKEFLSLDGEPAGENRGEMHYKEMALGSSVQINPLNNLYLAFRKISFDGEGGGHLRPEAVTTFWEEIISGDRIYLYSLGLDSLQYMIGIESQRSNRLTLRGGLQYVSASPATTLHHWTPFPLIGIGRLDETMEDLNIERMQLGILTFGFSYSRDNNWRLTYGIGQYIPIKIDRRTKEGGMTREDVVKGGEIKGLVDTIRNYPGGNFQSLVFLYHF